MSRITLCGYLLLAVMLLFPQNSTAEDYDALIQKGIAAKNAGQFTEALDAFAQAKAFNENSSEAWYLEGAVLSFQKKYDEAITHLEKALALDPKNTEAKEHLARVRTWKRGAETRAAAPAAAPADYRWQVDTGYASSRFSRVEQENWRDGTLQLNHFSADGLTRVYGKYEIFRRFSTYNRHYELGAEHRFNPDITGYASLGRSPDADFIPEWKFKAGGTYRLLHKHPLLGDTILTFDAIRDDYEEGIIRTLNPGLQYYVNGDIWLTLKHINVIDADDTRLKGWFLRGDWQVCDFFRLNLGTSNAPETVDGVPVDTRSRFIGGVFNLTDTATLYLGFSRDDRQDSYINKTVSSGLAVKF